jgi:hypothetical protein
LIRKLSMFIPMVALLLGVPLLPASAHPATSFHACAAYKKFGGSCLANASYGYGMTVHLRGKVDPPHSGYRARVMRKAPGASTYTKVGTIDISEGGVMRWDWKTSINDAVQNKPYRFEFNIAGHATSNIIKVFVLFGE